MPRKISILHCSDLHYDRFKPHDSKIVIDAFIDDIYALRAAGKTIDLVIFSGDLVQAGGDRANYSEVGEIFIKPLIKATGISDGSFILAPGNHDINANDVVSYVEAGLRAEFSSVEKINSFIDGAITKRTPASTAAISRMDPYEEFVSCLDNKSYISNEYFYKTRVIPVNGINVGIAAMNSSWRATGSIGDKGNIIIGEHSVDLAVRDITSSDIKICVFHHPFDWLSEIDVPAVESRIFNSFDLVCTGHTHRQMPSHTQNPTGSAVVSQSGTLYAGRRYFNGYQLIEWDEAARLVTFVCRVYHDVPRRVFAPAENLSPGGIFVVELKPRSTQLHLDEIELFLRQTRSVIRENADDQISLTQATNSERRDDITEAFVCQPLTWHLNLSDKIGGATAELITAEDVLKSDKHTLLFGEQETGRTSLVHYMAVRAAEGVSDKRRIPVVVSMRFVVQSGSYERSIRSYFADADVKSQIMAGALQRLPWIVFVDDYEDGDSRHVTQLDYIAKNFPLHKLVIVCGSQLHRDCDRVLGDERIQGVDVGYLSRKGIRQLSRVRYTSVDERSTDDSAYNLVMRQINDARLPRTGYIVTLLLWAAQRNNITETLNEAVLLENLISFLLGKTQFEAALRDQFDPRAQEFLLREIANELRKFGGWMESNALLNFIIAYFDEKGMRFGARQVLDQLIACRLLAERDGYISFRHTCYQEYFIALDLLYCPEKVKPILMGDSEAVLGYRRELDLWSSLARTFHGSDQSLLKILEDAGLSQKAGVGDIGQLSFIGHELRIKPSRVREILDNPLTKDQLDDLLDGADQLSNPQAVQGPPQRHIGNSDPASDPHPPKAPTKNDDGWRLIVQRNALTLLTRIVRNCDHENVDNKRKMINVLLQLWSGHTFHMLEEFFTAVEKNKDEVIRTGAISAGDIETMVNIVRVIGPTADMSTVCSLLSVAHIRPTLREIATHKDLPEGVKFSAAMAFSETWDKEGIDFIRKRHPAPTLLPARL